MLIHNTTFMMLPEREREFVAWLRERAGALTRCGDAPRLSTLRRAEGMVDADGGATSVAFQMEFGSMEEVEGYATGILPPLIAAFEREFGPEALTFTSVFETIDL